MKRGCSVGALVILLAGCGMDIRTTGFLDRMAGATALRQGAAVAVTENAQAENPVFDREVKAKIEKLLDRCGYRIAAPGDAEYIVTYGYSISAGLRSSAVTSYGPPQTQIVSIPDGRGGVTTRAITTAGQPTLVPMVSTEYTRQLTLKVATARREEDKKGHVLWVGETHSTDPSSDLRADIDNLLVVTFRYFGQDTGRQVRVNLSPDDPELRELRGETGRTGP